MDQELKMHPLCEKLPEMTGAEKEALEASIAAHGLIDPITILDGKILDGRDRYHICRKLNKPIKTVPFDPSFGSPVEFVIARAQHRNLTIGQRAFAAANLHEDLAKGRKLGRPPKKSGKKASITGNTRDIAAKPWGLSPRLLQEALDIKKKSPALFHKLGRGEVKVSQASNRLKLLERKAAVKKSARAFGKIARTTPDWRIILGDCIEGMQTLKAGSVRTAFADSQYNIGWEYKGDDTHDNLSSAEFLAFYARWVAQAVRLLADDGSIFCLINDLFSADVEMILRAAGLHRRGVFVWWESFGRHTPTNFTPCARFIHYYTKKPSGFIFNGDDILIESTRNAMKDKRANEAGKIPGNVWPVSRLQGTADERVPFFGKGEAPPQLPLEIPRRCILVSSNPGDLVLDPFTGNGTTAIAALQNGRRFIGCEKERQYKQQAEEWIKANLAAAAAASKASGKTPAKTAAGKARKIAGAR
jgi:site-specific DNA-methyltransferase (adenine-specific)